MSALILGVVILAGVSPAGPQDKQDRKDAKAERKPGPVGFPSLQDFSKALSLTEKQEELVRDLYGEYAEKEEELRLPPKKKGAPPSEAELKLRSELAGRIALFLSEAQRKAFEELPGPKRERKKSKKKDRK